MTTTNAKQNEPAETRPASHLALRWRIVISLLLLFHLAAVFLPPFDFSTDRSSPLTQTLLTPLRPYIDAAYLDHGYFFFAPNPGPSHLVRYKLEFADGREPVEQTFPDLNRHWPRLLYHRHFMLAEALHNSFAPPTPPAEIANDQQELARWRHGRDLYEAEWKAFEQHLKHKYGAEWVTLTRVEHRQPSIYEFADQGMRLDDKRLYVDLSESEYLPRSAAPQYLTPAPWQSPEEVGAKP